MGLAAHRQAVGCALKAGRLPKYVWIAVEIKLVAREPGDALREALRSSIADALGKPLAPREVQFVRDLPKTRNAKIMRRVIRAAYLGLNPGDVSSLENPSAIEEIRRVQSAPSFAYRASEA